MCINENEYHECDILSIEYKNFINNILSSTDDDKSYCMKYPKCLEYATESHIFQEKRILTPVAPNNVLYMFKYRPIYFDDKIYYNRVPTRHCLTFKGFCKEHDDKLFAPIEKHNNIDWNNVKSQYLLAYKCLCRELYVKMKDKTVLTKILTYIRGPIVEKYKSKQDERIYSIKHIIKYKDIIENGVYNNDYKYNFITINLPFQIDLFLSAPISISYHSSYSIMLDRFELNIVNIFPYKGETIVILGYDKLFKNIWLNQIINKLQSNDNAKISEALQDILFRSDCHCFSEKLYNAISNKLNLFINEWYENKDNFNLEIKYTSNIFKDYINSIRL